MPFYQPDQNQGSGTGGGFADALDKNSSDSSKGFYASLNQPKTSNADLNSIDGLLKLAREKGLIGDAQNIANPDKLSFLQRLSIGLGAFNPAEAIARDYQGTESFLTAYPTTVVQGIASALTGNDYGEQTKRRYFSDLLDIMGVDSKIERFGLGLVGDIFLDPSTYVGGTIARLGIKGVGAVAKIGLKGIAKVSPEAAASLVKAGQSLKDAGGELFVYGYGASKMTKEGVEKGLATDLLEYQGKKVNVLKALAISNAKRHGTDVLTDGQWEEFLGYIFKGKNAEFNYFDQTTDEMLTAFNDKFPNAKFPLQDTKAMKATLTEKLGREPSDIEVRSAVRTQTVGRLESLSTSIPQKIGRLQELRNKLAQPFIEGDLMGLKQIITDLRKELDDLIPKEVIKVPGTKPFVATSDQMDSSLMNALSMKKDEYKKIILDLQARLNGIESGIIKPAMKEVTQQIATKSPTLTADEISQQAMRKLDPSLKIKDKITELTNQITQVTNDMFSKQRILENALAGKQIAKERIAKAFTSGDFSTLPDELTGALHPVIDDPAVSKALTERLARNAQVASAAGIEDPFTMYAPSIAKDVPERQRILNFFSGTNGIRIGSKDYMKEFRGLLKDEDLVKDRSLFLRVEDQVATNKITEDFLKKTVEDYGMALSSFKNEREAAASGYKILKDQGIFGKEVGYIKEADWKFLNSQMTNNYGAIDKIAKALGFDAATSLFKRFVTGLFAPFHVRNYASGEIQNFELIGATAQLPKVQAAGLRLGSKVSAGAFSETIDPFDKTLLLGRKVVNFGNETIMLHGKEWKLDDIGQAIERRFGGSSRYNIDYNTVVNDADKLIDSKIWSAESLKSWAKSFTTLSLTKNPVEGLIGENNPLFRQARVIGAWVEQQQKAKLVVGALEKGMSMDEALNVAAKGGFDYRALTKFESKIMRRIIPFYSFNRFNVELQLKTLGENPQRINQIIRGVDNVQNLWETDLTSEEKANLPQYIKEFLSVPVGRGKNGAVQFITSFGTPIEAFTQLFKTSAEGKSSIERTFLSTLSMVNPYIKVPIEFGIGKDSFRQRDIKDVYNAQDYEIAPQFLKDFLKFREVIKKDTHGIPRTSYIADPDRLHIVQNLFTSRGFTYFTNVFNNDIKGFFKVLDLTSGIKVQGVDLERQAGFTDRRKQEELGALLRRYGIISEFNKLFIPKQK